MGSNTVRSQMDVRICLRVRERRDVDLILGQGSVNSGWHAHTLTQPGTFLLSAREHTVPHRARAYLITDDHVTRHVATYARHRPRLHDNGAPARPQSPQNGEDGQAGTEQPEKPVTPEIALWTALRRAGPGGISATALVKITGKGRTWVYERLREHIAAGRAVQTRRGHWCCPSLKIPMLAALGIPMSGCTKAPRLGWLRGFG